MLATASQPEPSANAPCTRTTFLICVTTVLLCSRNPLGSIDFRCPPMHQVALVLLSVDVCGSGSLFDELGCLLRVRHIGHMAGAVYFDRLGMGALRHHSFLLRIDRPVCRGHHVPAGLGLPCRI